jgi:hypothetical protein
MFIYAKCSFFNTSSIVLDAGAIVVDETTKNGVTPVRMGTLPKETKNLVLAPEKWRAFRLSSSKKIAEKGMHKPESKKENARKKIIR